MNKNQKQLMETLRACVLDGTATDGDYARCKDLEQIHALERAEALRPKWWHWMIEYCPKCQTQRSQCPVSECLGEDCVLFEKVEEYNRAEEFKCECGTTTMMKYRHALADCNCIQTEDGEAIRKAPLLPNQREGDGTFMTEAEYAGCVAAQTKTA